jgi:hypothetical protein
MNFRPVIAIPLFALLLVAFGAPGNAAQDPVLSHESAAIASMNEAQLESFLSRKAAELANEALAIRTAPIESLGRETTKDIVFRRSQRTLSEALAAAERLDVLQRFVKKDRQEKFERNFLPPLSWAPGLVVGIASLATILHYFPHYLDFIGGIADTLEVMIFGGKIGLGMAPGQLLGMSIYSAGQDSSKNGRISRLLAPKSGYRIFMRFFEKELKERGLKLQPVSREQLQTKLCDTLLSIPEKSQTRLLNKL